MDFIRITVIDILDILAIATILYYFYKISKGTQATSIIVGVVTIYVGWLLVRALNMEMLSAVLGYIIGLGVVALVVVFQPEIRRFLQMLGKKSQESHSTLLGRFFSFKVNKRGAIVYLNPMVTACMEMSADKTGALIVIQRRIGLKPVIESGIRIDAVITASLIKNIFFKNAPLHDGAVVIVGERIVAAKCVLPSTTNNNIPKSFGMRHRAALGMSEESDAVVVAVSEETGRISVAVNGGIEQVPSSNLYEVLSGMMNIEGDDVQQMESEIEEL